MIASYKMIQLAAAKYGKYNNVKQLATFNRKEEDVAVIFRRRRRQRNVLQVSIFCGHI